MISSIKEFPQIMGILNVTPDSFSDGGKSFHLKDAVDKCLKMIDEGADIIDIGGESTRPDSDAVDLTTESERVIPVIREVRKINNDIKISLDTTKYEIAKQGLDLGVNMINDISGLRFEPRLAELAANYDVPLVLMHSRDYPKTMQNNPEYKDLWSEITFELNTSINIAKQNGVENIIIDPGIGFAKSFDDNLKILKELYKLRTLNYPILLGISRKGFIGKIIDESNPEGRDFATMAYHTLLLKYKINIIRVHNIKLAVQLKKIYQSLI